MINETANPVQWAMLLYDLDDAKEHLGELTDQLAKDGKNDEENYAVQLGHVFAHLNRNWNARNLDREIHSDEWHEYSKFPSDLNPVG